MDPMWDFLEPNHSQSHKYHDTGLERQSWLVGECEESLMCWLYRTIWRICEWSGRKLAKMCPDK